MPKIDIAKLDELSGSRYPSPYDVPCVPRRWKRLGAAAGLTQFGVNLVTLPPGAWSSQRHWHSHEDEFVQVISGQVVMVTDAGRERMGPGDCAGFAAGVRDGHHFINETDVDAVLLVIGTSHGDDWGEYSDIDMKFLPNRYAGGGGFATKDNQPLNEQGAKTLADMAARGAGFAILSQDSTSD